MLFTNKDIFSPVDGIVIRFERPHLCIQTSSGLTIDMQFEESTKGKFCVKKGEHVRRGQRIFTQVLFPKKRKIIMTVLENTNCTVLKTSNKELIVGDNLFVII